MNILKQMWYSYLGAFIKFGDFKTRSDKFEFWGFSLINNIVSFTLGYLALVNNPISILAFLYGIAVIIPGITISIRRLHDVGRSGWWLAAAALLFVARIPHLPSPVMSICILVGFVASFYVFILTLCPSEKDNKYGPKPEENKERLIFGNLLILFNFILPFALLWAVGLEKTLAIRGVDNDMQTTVSSPMHISH